MSASTTRSRSTLFTLALLATSGLFLGWNKGQLPIRDVPGSAANVHTPNANADHPVLANAQLAADLALYCEMVHAVRCGANYYDAGREKIPQYGFPIASPLNWRLPTYAWLFSLAPQLCLVQLTLIALSITALALAFAALSRTSGVGLAAITTFLLFGVVRWSIDGYAFLAQEPWAATLMLLSLSAGALASCEPKPNRWRWLAVGAGIAALLFRELALPYCGIACLLAGWNRRWWEAAAWTIGIVLFFGFFAWHVGQVRAQMAGTEIAASAGLSQWLRCGGLDFVLLTTRMNSLLFASPSCFLWLYLLLSLIGLSQRTDETSQLACLSTLAYLLAFAFLGRPENFYWGLLPAPLLAWGLADGLRAVATRVPLALQGQPCTTQGRYAVHSPG